MELTKNYLPKEIEQKWYSYWLQKGAFSSTPNHQSPYTIVIPPPNVTGVLHMGHALNNSVQDVLIRYAKLNGYNTCWVPGTDHASIATEAKVAAMLRDRGIDKNNLERDEFLKYAWEWKEKYGGIILQQLKKLGCSLDWNRTSFTMDKDYYDAVIDVFIDLFNKGYIYRGVKMINWDPKAKTALSDEEVIHKEVNSKLVYIRYELETPINDHTYITIATVRPETILGDVAICVHPEDERYKALVGSYCFVPLINRKIPIIADEYIDIEFGTGCLKVTPAHDINDYNLGLKHQLEIIDTLNEDGTLSEAAQLYIGQDRFDVRKKIIEDLQAKGHIDKIEDYKNQVGFSERTDAVIEPRLSMQWWCKMENLAKPALDVVMNDEIKFYPSKFKNTYRHWMSNIKDWCISRQLRWGHRIPAWYDTKGNFIIAKNEEQAKELYQKQYGVSIEKLSQDEDVLDTWFSSWLWPLEVFGWNKNKANNQDLNYYYPTSTLVTAPEIIFFWVARMIMAGIEYRGTIPFKQVYFTGIVRDKQGRKMSKSLGNSPDLLKLIDEYGADSVRFGVLIASPAGNDLLFDESSLEQGKIFCNKLWNAFKLLQIFKSKPTENSQRDDIVFASQYFEAKLNSVKQEIQQDLSEFKLSEALKKIYTLIWSDYCSDYLEWIKTPQDSPMNHTNITKAFLFFEELIKLLHPFMPFITQEIYHLLQTEHEDIFSTNIDYNISFSHEKIQQGEWLKNLITQVRDIKVKQNLKPKDEVCLYLPNQYEAQLKSIELILQKQIFAQEIIYTNQAVSNGIAFLSGTFQCYLTTEKEIDHTQQKQQLLKDIEYYKGFLVTVDKKLNNENFIKNAKAEVIELELKKKNDAEQKLKILEESLNLL
ncbi:MAG TPA: valine--tRNA ligase [Chitinophagaceae bacterium]|nr:MAG: valyl-tRNA synthetase [Bacteroidetes bacterium OLB11]HMN33366.1 valine--tRNA ligase [Chitinophagaceae bacterium]